MHAQAILLFLAAATLAAAPVRFKTRCLEDLTAQVPEILASQDRASGRFGAGIWIVNDQNAMLPLAAAWSWKAPANRYYHSPEVLDAIMAAGDALIADQDARGQWVFRKKDGSTWGSIYMPWTYSRWVRAYSMIRGAMPPERRDRWEKALRLGYTGIARDLASGRVHNIPAHHAMGLHFAGKALGEPEWVAQAAAFLRKVAEAQRPDGYWSEGAGPVVAYGFVYVDALGVYYSETKDAAVLPALARTARFHSYFSYPDGADVETVDERNPFHAGVRVPNPGFTHTAEGRAWTARQIGLRKDRIPADEAAALLLWGREGEGASGGAWGRDFDFVLGSGDAAVRKRGPWYLVASAMTAPVPESRWIQDRQNFVSVYHQRAGLILGGGNTKLQPAWSNFTVGDEGLLRHRAGDEQPRFRPSDGIVHTPVSARLLPGKAFGVELDYGGRRGRIRLEVAGPDRLEYIVEGTSGMAAHVTVLPRMGETVTAAAGESAVLGGEAFRWPSPGAWIEHGGVRMVLPEGAAVRWPALPHNPYRKAGDAEPAEGRLVIDIPAEARLTLEVAPGRRGRGMASH